ncbi:hypothetical protein SASPL_112564 [Salvia splendens]|uniref:Disease resistance protein RPM1 n=1 Tax=Salvia splendens TaxID=180675 RepID=A0A8X8YER5_SALSN|nr:hypothetical protein SASPL_112564 [Salvia splendens]
MAYNLQSLITILEGILNPHQSLWNVDRNKPQLQSLLQKAESLLQILEKSSLTNIPSNLESQIRDISYKTEDIIETRIVSSKLMQDRITKFEQVVSNRVSLAFPTSDLQQVTKDLDLAMEQVLKLKETRNTMLSGASFSHGEVQQAAQQLESINLAEVVEKKMPALSSSKNNLVGVDADLYQLLPDGISRLHNLQTLICPHFMPYVPSALWDIYELIHVRFAWTLFKIRKIKFDLKKPQTLFTVWVTPNLISSGFFEAIRNIIKLGIHYEDSPNIEVDLSHLHKLEILHCQSKLDKDGICFLHKLKFPSNLRKLNLASCVVFRSLFTTLCTLPNLEVLRILKCVFEREGEAEEEWEATEVDEFCSLLFLQLESLNLVHWKADATNFPKLRELFVFGCYKLEEIPNAMGDIPALQRIHIYECGTSIVASAQKILKVQQEEYGNYDLKLYIR